MQRRKQRAGGKCQFLRALRHNPITNVSKIHEYISNARARATLKSHQTIVERSAAATPAVCQLKPLIEPKTPATQMEMHGSVHGRPRNVPAHESWHRASRVIILHFGLKLDDCNLFSLHFVLLTIPQSIRHHVIVNVFCLVRWPFLCGLLRFGLFVFATNCCDNGLRMPNS